MSYFLDFSGLTNEDYKQIKHSMATLNINFNQAIGKYMNENPGKIKVLAEVKDGKIIRDEIDENGVHEYKGQDAIRRMMGEAMQNKINRKNKKEEDNEK